MSLIQLHYGPYEAHGIIRHRPQRLHGLVCALTSKGYEVELIQTQHLNRLTVDIRGVMVFRCDIRNLLFNIGADDDVVCQRAIGVIEEACKRIFDETNIPKFVSVDEGMRYIQAKRTYTTEHLFQASGIGLLFEIQDQYKEPEKVVSILGSTPSKMVREKEEPEHTGEEVSAVDISKSMTYNQTADSSAPTSAIISNTFFSAVTIQDPEVQKRDSDTTALSFLDADDVSKADID